jgi:hypothetical protein
VRGCAAVTESKETCQPARRRLLRRLAAPCAASAPVLVQAAVLVRVVSFG